MEVNQGQTTTFFLKTELPVRFGSRPLGLITSSKGVFINEGTTTEYATRISGTSIDGVYAKIQSTDSRVFSAVSDTDAQDQTTGVVSSTTITRIRGQTTTIETTQLVRTFIDDVYVQEIISGTETFAPLSIEASAVVSSSEPQPTVEIAGSQTMPQEDDSSALIFRTSHLTQIVGERVVELAADLSSSEEEDVAVTEEDRKKLIATFSEDAVEFNHRGMRKLEPLLLLVSKPSVVLETIQARAPLDPSQDAPETSDDVITEQPATTEPAPEVSVASEQITDEVPQSFVVSAVDAFGAANREPRLEVSSGNPFVVMAASAPVEVLEASLIVATLNLKTGDAVPVLVPSPVVVIEPTVSFEESTTAFDAELLEGSMEDTTESGLQLETPTDQLALTTRLTTFTLFSTELVTEDGTTSSLVKTRQVISTQVELVPVTPTEPVQDSFTTLFTTYTYFSTLFDELTTKLINREEVVTNVVAVSDLSATAVLDTQQVTSTAAADVSSPEVESSILDGESGERKSVKFLGDLAQNIVRTFFTTFTFFTTQLVDGSTVTSSRIVVSTNAVTPTVQLDEIDEELWESLKAQDDARKALKGTSVVEPTTPTPAEILEATESTETPSESEETSVPSESALAEAGVTIAPTPVVLVLAASPPSGSSADAPATESTTELTFSEDPSSSEVDSTTPFAEESPAAEEVDPLLPVPVIDPSPTEAPLTFYTTFTYFTTLFTNGVSNLVSREETVTHVAGDDAQATPVPSVFPITYYTTYTYRTTSLINEEQTIFTREETVSNVVTPAVGDASQVEPTATLTITPTVDPMQTTFYTTFTYYSTSVDAETTLVTSSMETITNVVSATPTVAPQVVAPTAVLLAQDGTARAVEDKAAVNNLSGDQSGDLLQPTGLLSTIHSTEFNAGLATVFTTQVMGTFINGQYARIMESSSEVLPSAAIVQATRSPAGVVSLNIASVYDVDHPVTTVFTTKVVGFYTDDVYSQSTDRAKRLEVDGDRTIPVQDSFRTGLVRVTSGTIVAASSTTIYQTKVLGTFLNGLYAEVLESSSSVLLGEVPATVIIAASGVEFVQPTVMSDTSSPLIQLEGSIESTAVEGVDGDSSATASAVLGLGARSRITSRLTVTTPVKTFTPAIRPFNKFKRPAFVRNRAPFSPKDKSPGLEVDDESSSTGAVVEATVESSSAQSFNGLRSSSNRFNRPSVAITLSSTSFRGTTASSRNKFFRLRGSSSQIGSNVINPTPVSSGSFAATASSSRRFSVSAGPRSTFNGFSSRVRSTGFPRSESSTRSVTSLVSTSRRFSFPNRNKNVETAEEPEKPVDILEEEKEEIEIEETTGEISSEEVNNDISTTTPGSPVRRPTNSRRQFPLGRSSTSRIVTTESPQDSQLTTTRPRFRRPPKIVFTLRPRQQPSRSGPRRLPFGRSKVTSEEDLPVEPAEEEEEEETSAEETGFRSGRSKRHLSPYEENFYEQHQPSTRSRKRSPQRSNPSSSSSSRRSQTRLRSRPRPTVAPDVDYDYFDDSDEEVTKRPTSRGSALSIRERIQANKERKTSPTRASTSSRSRPTSASSRRPSSSSSSRFRSSSGTRPSSTRRRPSSSRTRTSSSSRTRRPTSRRPSFRVKAEPEFSEEVQEVAEEVEDGLVIIPTPVTATHYVPVKTVISAFNADGESLLKTVLTAQPSVEILNKYTTSKIEGTWQYIASEVTAIPNPGVTEMTTYLIKSTPTTTVTFTPTTIRGRLTSFSHVIPSTKYDIEAISTTISDPVASTNNLLQQLLLGGLGGTNPLLALQNTGDNTPVTSYREKTSTYVTTLTELKSTVFPLTLRGKVHTTTIIGTSSSVITATEVSTETIVIEPTMDLAQSNPLASLLPALLGNPILQAQLLNQQPFQAQPIQPQTVQPIETTAAPARVIQPEPELEEFKFESEEEVFQAKEEPIQLIVEPAQTALPQTSVVTLYLSGRFPGEFSSVLSTITLDGPDASVVKRQTSPSEVAQLQMEASALPYMVETDAGFYKLPEYVQWQDMDYYIMSAMNEVDDQYELRPTKTTPLAPVHKSKKTQDTYQSNAQVTGRKILQFDDDDDDEELEVAMDQLHGHFGSRKRSPQSGDDSDPAEILPSKTPRKLVVVTKRKLVTPTQRPANVLPETDVPSIASSKEESSASIVGGNIFAPRVYYTVYSYLYTILNGAESGLVSSREVTVSKPVRGRDTLLPTDFQRTETVNGLYLVASGRSVSQLNPRVRNDVTTQVNLASVTLVKYGRGRASMPNPQAPAPQVPSLKSVEGSTRIRVRPTQIEPSFEPFADALATQASSATERLPSARPSRTRTSAKASAKAPAVKVSAEADPIKTSAPTKNRGRGTIRFISSARGQSGNAIAESAVRPLSSATRRPTVNRSRGSPSSAVRGSRIRASSVRRITTETTSSRQVLRGATRHRLPAVGSVSNNFDDPQSAEENIDEFENDFYDQEDHFHDADGSFEYYDYSDEEQEQPIDQEGQDYEEYDYEEYDYAEEPEEPEVSSSTPSSTTSSTQSVRRGKASKLEASTTATPTARIIATSTRNSPVRSSFVRKTVNPLDRHLSSILAHSRSSLLRGSTSRKSFDPVSSSTSNRFRLAQRLSSTTASPISSTVVLKTFSTTSTLALDGGRNGIELTLLTSTLTTLFDDDLKLLTQSPDLFKPVSIQPTAVLRPNPNRLKTTRSKFSFRPSLLLKNPPADDKDQEQDVTEWNSIEDITESTFSSSAEDVLTSTDIASSMEEKPQEHGSPDLSLLLPLIRTQVDTQLRTFTAVVTRVSGDESLVTTRLEVVTELVTKTIIQPTSGIHSIPFLPYIYNFFLII